MSFLDTHAVMKRITTLRDMGAREIRFVDPSFNSHPQFEELLRALVAMNRSHALEFFAEINAERLNPGQAQLLARAHFRDIEVGMQTRNRTVLRAIRRPTDASRLDAGVRMLMRQGIRVTLDVMYGLPLQTAAEVRNSLRHAARLRGVNVQSLQTLLLPGTELRRRRREWKMQAGLLPPYGVTATSTLSGDDMRRIEVYVSGHPRLRSDLPTPVFVARRLPGLFREKVRIDAHDLDPGARVPGRENRRAVLIGGEDLFGHRDRIARFVRQTVRREPDVLWQFVLDLRQEEPLDLLDAVIAVLRDSPSHCLDRYAAPACDKRIVSRRILIQTGNGSRISSGWMSDAEQVLRHAFF